MLSSMDDYPLHQIADVIRHAGTSDRNFYDRYWFNGFDKEGAFLFEIGFGLYPNRRVMDGHFSVVVDGVQHSVREFVQCAFECVGLNHEDYVRQDANFIRPAEVNLLIGDPSKARRDLFWRPRVSFRDLVMMMVDADLRLMTDHTALPSVATHLLPQEAPVLLTHAQVA